MLFFKINILVLLSTVMKYVAAHGTIPSFTVGTITYPGYNYSIQPPIKTAAWSNSIGEAYVGYKDSESPTPWRLNSDDIICAQNGTPGATSATIQAGQKIIFHWSTWPIGHLGPVITYMANCNASCQTVDKTKLRFFKIAESGLLNKSRSSPYPDYPSTGNGFWAGDILSYNRTSEATIPKSLAPGNYVVRHETMGMQHIFLKEIQAYPFCFNFIVNGTGTAHPKGVLGTQLYNKNESAFSYDVYGPANQTLPDFKIPGPPLWVG
ncbi:glycoside hydrolase [Tricladium varicosporioides]|nr:glycoside hydrolase [Hymenoscyphus varicosporioides]